MHNFKHMTKVQITDQVLTKITKAKTTLSNVQSLKPLTLRGGYYLSIHTPKPSSLAQLFYTKSKNEIRR